MSAELDVVVLGGGPAGLQTAGLLARLGRTVAVLDRPRKEGPRVGETVGPEVRQLLAENGFEGGYDKVPSLPFVGSRMTWGSAEPFERPGILNPLGEGKHLDRAAFDDWLKNCAIDCGATVHTVSDRLGVEPSPSGWEIVAGSEHMNCRYLVEARGRSATGLVRGRTWIAFDRLIGVVGWLDQTASDDPDLLIEAVPQGWWYSANLPESGLVATLMTDADLIHGSGLEGLTSSWQSALTDAPLTRQRLDAATLARGLEVKRADSGYSVPDRGSNWRAVGDAAAAWDPLAGSGIANAIRSATIAAHDIDLILNSSARALEAPSAPPHHYLDERARYYAMETRWPDSLFWMRRRPFDERLLEIFLHPEARLRAIMGGGTPTILAEAESVLPPRAIRALLGRLQEPAPAHLAMEFLRAETGRLDDRRLLAGVQMLIRAGAIEMGSD